MAGRAAPTGFLFLTTIFLSACMGLGEIGVAPTFDLNPIYTAAARTHSAELTAAATTPASVRNTPTTIITTRPPLEVEATATFIPIPLEATATAFEIPLSPTLLIPTLTPRALYEGPACDAALTLRDLTFPDGASVRAKGGFFKEWLVENTGTCPWSEGYWLVHVDGPQMGYKPQKLRKVSEPTIVWPGGVAEIGTKLVAPSKLGYYTSTFQLMNDWGGSPFGWLMVRVMVTGK
jgi:hypothetical protein